MQRVFPFSTLFCIPTRRRLRQYLHYLGAFFCLEDEQKADKMPNYYNDHNILAQSLSKSKDGKYRSFILRLANEFTIGDLKALKYFLEDEIPAGTLESFNTALDIFSYLQRQGLIGPGKLDELRNLLVNIGRPKLVSMLDDFDDSCSVFPLKPKSDNYLEMYGYRVEIKGGRHFETTEG